MFRKAVVIVLLVTLNFLFFPQNAHASDITTFSSGVVAAEDLNASTGNTRVYRTSYGSEEMVSAVTNETNYQKVVIDDQLTLEYWYTTTQQGEKVLDTSTVTYGGVTRNRHGSETYIVPGECVPDQGCPEPELHPALEAQIALIQDAMSGYSPAFVQAVSDAADEAEVNGWIGCGVAIVLYVQSTFDLIFCVAVWPCLGAIAVHVAASVWMACECAGHCP